MVTPPTASELGRVRDAHRLSVGEPHHRTLASLFESDVAVACLAVGDSSAEPPISDEAWLRDASPTRQREFAGGRACARRALVGLGLEPVPVGRGVGGEPLWPAGVVGSITHADGLCAAAAARTTRLCSLGLDIEPERDETLAFVRRICNEAELAAMQQLGEPIETLGPAILSAKEASYKLQFPLTHDLEAWGKLEVLLSADTFTVRFRDALGGLANRQARGRWRRAHGFIWAGVALPQS